MAKHPRRWSVSLIRKKAEDLGTVSAPDEKTAIDIAAEEFHIPPERRNRIVVTRSMSETRLTRSPGSNVRGFFMPSALLRLATP
jgi:hypothetical protein